MLSCIREILQYEYILTTNGAEEQHALSSWEKNSTKLEMQISSSYQNGKSDPHGCKHNNTLLARKEQLYGFTEGVNEIQLYTMYPLPQNIFRWQVHFVNR